VHIAWHEQLLGMQKKQKMQQEQQGQEDPDQQGGKPQDAQKPSVGKDKKDPKSAASPLKQEMTQKPAKQ